MAGKPAKPAQQAVDDVDAFMSKLKHPLKPTLEAVRAIIAQAAPGISEGIKWNSPGFFYKDWFATTGVRDGDFVRVVFHTGAKAKGKVIKINDTDGLLEWHAKDRCSARFASAEDAQARRAALTSIVKQWIKQM
jgi:hypothetical protein